MRDQALEQTASKLLSLLRIDLDDPKAEMLAGGNRAWGRGSFLGVEMPFREKGANCFQADRPLSTGRNYFWIISLRSLLTGA